MQTRFLALSVSVVGLSIGVGGVAKATTIASDSFLTTATATAGFYAAGNINTQTNTGGTTGYYTGAAVGNQVAGWTSGTGAFLAQTTPLTNPLTANPYASANDGSYSALGNANNRLQYRDFASIAPPASTSYYFSTLLQESSNSYTGSVYAGVGQSRATGANATVPTTGYNVGFLNGALTLFYNNGGASYATQTLVATPTVNSTYLAELALNTSTGTITPSIYNAAGVLVNNPAAQTVTATVNTATDLGAFQSFITSNFSNGSPAAVTFDEFRFGTAESDVVAPEPATFSLVALAAGGLLVRRRSAAR